VPVHVAAGAAKARETPPLCPLTPAPATACPALPAYTAIEYSLYGGLCTGRYRERDAPWATLVSVAERSGRYPWAVG
jgi:hypothetical protein